jgi:hypothetical protein
LGWPQTAIFSISVSQVAGIIGISLFSFKIFFLISIFPLYELAVYTVFAFVLSGLVNRAVYSVVVNSWELVLNVNS